MEPWVASHCDPGFALGGFLGNSKPHPRRIGHRTVGSRASKFNSKTKATIPMLESLSLTARQRAMIDNTTDGVPIDRVEKFRLYDAKLTANL
jgi:hypothetical protein